MNSGFVYILINQSMPNVIKVGKTKRDSRIRAKELSNTSVPTPFTVAFEIFSDNMDELENKAHEKLEEFRISSNREFFRYPLKDAIKLLQNLNSPPMEKDSSFIAVSIYKDLLDKYEDYLVKSITDVRILQSEERIWLEITNEEIIAEYLKDVTIKRTDLGFIIENNDINKLFFNPNDNIYINAQKFINEFDTVCIINTTNLFTKEACKNI